MEHSVSYIFIIIVPIISTILYLLSKGMLIISAIGFGSLILFTIYIYNNLDRKETLYIIRSDGRVYFNLSDDQLFSVGFSDEESLPKLIENIVSNEIVTLKDLIDNINFINFKDDKLHRELNRLIQN
jgi:hypothetical protein